MDGVTLTTCRNFLQYVCLVAALILPLPGVAKAQDVYGGVGYDYWMDEEGEKGMQVYLPVGASAEHGGFGLEVLGGYAYTRVDPSGRLLYLAGDVTGGSAVSLGSFVDTKVNLTYETKGKFGCDIIGGLGINVPTGHTNLSVRELKLLVPPDLVTIKRFGEGLNINPRVSVARQWGDLAAGMGIGYTIRGKYDYSSQVESYDPGEIVTVTAEAGYEFNARWSSRLYGEYARYGTDKVETDGYYREGDVKLAGMSVQYSQPSWDANAGLTGIFRGKSKISQGYVLPREDRNSHGDEWIAEVTYRYYKDRDTTMSALMEYLYIKENDYSSVSAYYIGKRRKLTLGCSLDRMIREDVGVNASIRGFVMDDDRNWYHPYVDCRYKGISMTLSARKTF